MATGGNVADLRFCAVCLESYHNPKFLPCHHTFCAQCITDVASRHTGGSFPCPSCREPTSLPEGGATALQANFYLKSEDNSGSAKTRFCLIHPDKELELFCFSCDKPVCVRCMFEQHKKHNIVEIQTAACRMKSKLPKHKARLEKVIADRETRLDSAQKKQQDLNDKVQAVEKNIHNRHQIVIDAANKCRDEALDSLRSVKVTIESKMTRAIKEDETSLHALLQIQKDLDQSLNTGTDDDVLTIARTLRCGLGTQVGMSDSAFQRVNTITRPVLHFKVTGDVILQKTRGFMGTVTKMGMEVAAPEVRVVKRFPCGQEADIEVFSLCHVDSDPPCVRVSYERRGLKGDAVGIRFSEDGEYIRSSAFVGKVFCKRIAKGILMSESPRVGCINSHSKSRTTAHFQLSNNLSGKADVVNVKVTSSNPLTVEKKTEFSINVGAHRAFDVDETGQFFVVVEEPTFLEMWRKVKLYHRPGGYPVSTYTPPAHLSCFQPSDVCFYRLGGEQVLLVTDELNDCIHVVYFQSGQLSKVPFLAQGCPWLIQPTAITVDVSARLWLACRGGTILCMEPVDM